MSFIVSTFEGERDETTLSGEEELAELLAEHFGLVMSRQRR